jgi:hypothetical protein
MHSTRIAARRAALNTMLCAVAALLTLSMYPAGAEARQGRSVCANKLCTQTTAQAESCWSRDGRKRTAQCFITRAARHYRQPRGKAFQIAYRESRYDWRVTNRSSGAAGLFQFMPRTWEATPYRRYSPYNPRWAALAAMWMWKRGYQSHWSTY